MIPPLSPQTFLLLATHYSADQRHVWHLISFWTAHLKRVCGAAAFLPAEGSPVRNGAKFNIHDNFSLLFPTILQWLTHTVYSSASSMLRFGPHSSQTRCRLVDNFCYFPKWLENTSSQAPVKLVQTGRRVSRASADKRLQLIKQQVTAVPATSSAHRSLNRSWASPGSTTVAQDFNSSQTVLEKWLLPERHSKLLTEWVLRRSFRSPGFIQVNKFRLFNFFVSKFYLLWTSSIAFNHEEAKKHFFQGF